MPDSRLTDEMIEAAARAIFGGSDDVWQRNPGDLQERHIRYARAALAAIAPLLDGMMIAAKVARGSAAATEETR